MVYATDLRGNGVKGSGFFSSPLSFSSYEGVGVSPARDRFAVSEIAAASGWHGVRVVSRDGVELTTFQAPRGAIAVSPTWSGDGKLIAYALRHGPNDGDRALPFYFELVVADPGSPNTAKTVIHWPFEGYPGDPHVAFSPDATKLIFDGFVDGSTDLYTVRLDGTDVTRITTGGATGASWVP
jgi:Tol biopolymer transport system component